MAESGRPKTPPARQTQPAMDLTPEQVRRMEENRLKAKALRIQQQASEPRKTPGQYPAPPQIAGQKRAYTPNVPSTSRDARSSATAGMGKEIGRAHV